MIPIVTLIFIIGYLLIIFEHNIKIDKAVSALLAGVICWVVIAVHHESPFDNEHLVENLSHYLGEIASILFFLLGAMTIVELIDLHHGFDVVSSWIKSKSKIMLLIVVCTLSFFFSSILDNLTTTIVMVSLIRKLIHHNEDRLWYVSFIVIAANAGGAWSPIGDVTTTMLWIDHKVSTLQLIGHLFIPSILCIAVPILIASRFNVFQGAVQDEVSKVQDHHISAKFYLWAGVILLIMVPVFKALTHLPPFMGMLAAMSILWLISEIEHPYNYPEIPDKPKPTIRRALSRVEIPSILFFLGILLAISALELIGQLNMLGEFLDKNVNNPSMIVFVLGILSAVIDNVPLVAGALAMYDYPLDHFFWHQIAYAAGTGGSILIIGSAAGVAAMGLEKISYPWYFKRISFLAFIGYIAGWIYVYFNF